jgi:GTP-binding protein
VVFKVSGRKRTLLDFRYRHLFKASPGRHGQGQDKHGRRGGDLVLEVPPGTVVRDLWSGEVLIDLATEAQAWVAARGGAGGRGNARFVSSTRQVPRIAEDGQPGEEREFLLELKLIADVGLVGFPNAGKSTLIAAISAARPKIADYPFTTLVPNLGVVEREDAPAFVVADIPGLIEGAHEGAGLGTRFLRHIERTRVLVHLIDVSVIPAPTPLLPLRQIEQELKGYSGALADKVRIVALNKVDLLAHDPVLLETVAQAYRQAGYETVLLSARTRDGTQGLVRLLGKLLTAQELVADSLAD